MKNHNTAGAMTFDASIDLIGDHPPEAASIVRAAVQAIPGAAWVSVDRCAWPDDAPAPEWVRVWSRGSSRPVSGTEWDCLRDRVRDVALAAIAAESKKAPDAEAPGA